MSIQLNKDNKPKRDVETYSECYYGLDEIMTFLIATLVTLMLLALHIGAYLVVERSKDEVVVQSTDTVVQSTDTVETAINAVDIFGFSIEAKDAVQFNERMTTVIQEDYEICFEGARIEKYLMQCGNMVAPMSL